MSQTVITGNLPSLAEAEAEFRKLYEPTPANKASWKTQASNLVDTESFLQVGRFLIESNEVISANDFVVNLKSIDSLSIEQILDFWSSWCRIFSAAQIIEPTVSCYDFPIVKVIRKPLRKKPL